MHTKRLTASLALGLPLLACAAPVAEPNRFVAVKLRKANIPAAEARRARALARGVPETDLTDLTVGYLADVSLGSPAQPVTLLIDSGSSWLWVNPLCEYARNQNICLSAPRYDPAQSSPAPKRVPALDGYSDYAGGFWAQTQGYQDTFWLDGESRIANQAFGVAADSDGAYFGYLGLGPDLVSGFDGAAANYSVLNGMVSQGLINSRTYGLGLEETLTLNNKSPRSLIFGGVDKNKFRGKFVELPVLLPGKGGGDNYTRFWVEMSGFSHTLADGISRPGFTFVGQNARYNIDTGTTGIYLPTDIVASIMKDLKLDWSAGSFASIPCSRATEAGSFNFAFRDRTISIPYSTLVLENTPGSCVFLITSVDSNSLSQHILGLGFLRGAYTVFDWDNKSVFLAERKDCGSAPDVAAIAAGHGALEGIKGNCS